MKEVVGGEKPNSGCCVRIGVTSLSLDTVCGWKEWRVENDVSGNTTVLDRVPSGQLCVSSRGEVNLCYLLTCSHTLSTCMHLCTETGYSQR